LWRKKHQQTFLLRRKQENIQTYHCTQENIQKKRKYARKYTRIEIS